MFDAIPINGQTWLICGGRDFSDGAMFECAMAQFIRLKGLPAKVVHGGARGADAMADEWARDFAINVVPVLADWNTHGRGAGPIRNQKMLDDHRPSFIIAFPGGRGTADMVRRGEIRQNTNDH
jgi:hypothetical protein